MSSVQDTSFYKMWKANEKFYHFVMGIGVLFLLIVLITIGVQDQILKKEISETCGWAEEDYECYCEKSEAISIKNQLDMMEVGEQIQLYVNLSDGNVLEHPDGEYGYGWEDSDVPLDW